MKNVQEDVVFDQAEGFRWKSDDNEAFCFFSKIGETMRINDWYNC